MFESILHVVGAAVVFVVAWSVIYGLLGGWRAGKVAGEQGRVPLAQEAVREIGS